MRHEWDVIIDIRDSEGKLANMGHGMCLGSQRLGCLGTTS